MSRIRVMPARWVGRIVHWNILIRPYDRWIVAGSFQKRDHALTVAHDRQVWGMCYPVAPCQSDVPIASRPVCVEAWEGKPA